MSETEQTWNEAGKFGTVLPNDPENDPGNGNIGVGASLASRLEDAAELIELGHDPDAFVVMAMSDWLSNFEWPDSEAGDAFSTSVAEKLDDLLGVASAMRDIKARTTSCCKGLAPENECACAKPEISSLRSSLSKKEEEIECTKRNRDMWKGQCERQATRLETLHGAIAGFIALEEMRADNVAVDADAWAKAIAVARDAMGRSA